MVSARHCAPRAYEHFSRQLNCLDTSMGLLHAAIAISMHTLDQVEPSEVENTLTSWGEQIRSRVTGQQPRGILAHLHSLLFDELKLVGNSTSYYHEYNSYIPKVLEAKTGIPITLTLVYKVVAEKAGLQVEGINAPGHFLARVHAGDEHSLVDVFDGGKILTPDEAKQKLERMFQRALPSEPELFKECTHDVWLLRMMNNLQAIYTQESRVKDVAAIRELAALLPPSMP